MRLFSQRLFVCCCLLLWSLRISAQTPGSGSSSLFHVIERAEKWIAAGSYHVAQKELEMALPFAKGHDRQSEILVLLAQCTFEDQEFEQSYHWANEVLLMFPHDSHAAQILYIRGVSAFHIDESEKGIKDLSLFIEEHPEHGLVNSARYWRAMCFLDLERWTAAESDLQQALHAASDEERRDYAVMGLALLDERRGEYRQASAELEQLLSEYPRSELVTDAQIRLASLSLRTGAASRALELLKGVKPHTRSQREEYLILSAETYYRAENYSAAQSTCRDFLKQFPNSPRARTARFDLAWSYLKAGNAQQAQSEFGMVSAGNDSLANAALHQNAVIALLQGQPMLALNYFDTLVTRAPYDRLADDAYYQMGMIYYRNKKYRDARKDFQYVARLFPNSPLRPQSYKMMGECGVALGDFSNAQYAFAQVQKLGAPEDDLAEAMFQEGIVLYHLGRFSSSVDRLSEFLNKFPRHEKTDEAYVWKGEALYQDGKFDDAERAYSRALRTSLDNPKRIDASYGLAWTLFEQKKFSQAAEAFERFAVEFPQSGHSLDAALRKADCYFFLGQYDKAEKLYASLASVRGESKTIEYAAFQLSMSYIQRGEHDRGIQELRAFLNRFPNSLYNEVVQFNIAWTYFSNDHYTEAVSEFKTLIKLYPESQLMPRVMFNMGDAFYNLHQQDSARAYYQNVIQNFPSSPLAADAVSGLQYTYEAEGKTAEAVSAIQAFIDKNPTSSSQEELILKKGDILFGQGDFAGALQEYQRLMGMKPSPAIRIKTEYQLARTYDLENNPSRAASYYEQILSDTATSETTPAAALAYGLLQVKQHQYSKAAGILRGFDDKFSSSPMVMEATYHLGMAFQGLQEQDSAQARFQSVIQKHPSDIFAERSRIQIARIHQERKQYQAAIDTLEALLQRRNDDLAAEALVVMGDNYLRLKKYVNALQTFKDVIEQYKEFQLFVDRAHLGTGECYERLKEKNKAVLTYNEVLKSALDPAVKQEAQQRLKKLRR